ncbi:hypothetical protein HPP92_019240 [Vanilla planifolia]|uniref:DUF3741 domain-containing protein n=1 Tax=Vanilla planifolia TaxID=51239 RepID=A0A835Q6K0_VANPL|nr:hypothetical protein HPP92_019240 [Vanilla planifolia]
MKALSLFLLKNSISAKMKRGVHGFCSNHGSTSTLRQSGRAGNDDSRKPRTLEEMLLQLAVEEEELRLHRRMSCVDSAEIMRSARDALSQYPRFSLDGRDAMYRSSFVDCRRSSGAGGRRPAMVAGERVVWCKPGVVARLMGLDVVPVPVGRDGRGCVGGGLRKQSMRRMGKTKLI